MFQFTKQSMTPSICPPFYLPNNQRIKPISLPDFQCHYIILPFLLDSFNRIPHDFGMKRPPLIGDMETIKAKITLLEVLGDIQVG